MESRIQCVLLSIALLFSAHAWSADSAYDPEVERRTIDEELIDVNDIEIGVNIGVLSIEDFGSAMSYGLRLNYHVSEDFFFAVSYLQSEAGLTSYERLSGGALLLENRDYGHYGLMLGYNLFHGEAFYGEGTAINSAFYLLGGVGATQFADDNYFTIHAGVGYRFIPLDWLTVSVEFQDHIFEHELLGETKLINNLEFSTNITVFF